MRISVRRLTAKVVSARFFELDQDSLPHEHDVPEIGYVFSGDCELVIGNSHCHCPTNTFIYLPPFHNHFEIPKGHNRNIIAYVRIRPGKYMEGLLPEQALHLFCHPDNILRAMIREIIQNSLIGNPLAQDRIALALKQLCLELYRLKSNQEDSLTISQIRIHSLTTRAKDELDAHASDMNYNVEELARSVCISRRYLEQLFKKTEQCTPSEYLTALRIARAMEILKDQSLSVEMVAKRCGFASIHYFSRRFKQLTGKSPKEMRRS
jgi:AraC-like DNA-binding protein